MKNHTDKKNLLTSKRLGVLALVALLAVVLLAGCGGGASSSSSAAPPSSAPAPASSAPAPASTAPTGKTAPSSSSSLPEPIISYDIADVKVSGSSFSATISFGEDHDEVLLYSTLPGEEGVIESEDPVYTFTDVTADTPIPFEVTLDPDATYIVVEGRFGIGANDIALEGSSMPLRMYRTGNEGENTFVFELRDGSDSLGNFELPIVFE